LDCTWKAEKETKKFDIGHQESGIGSRKKHNGNAIKCQNGNSPIHLNGTPLF
jgi:hypothetical protein